MNVSEVKLLAERIAGNVSKVIVGKEEVLRLILAAILAKGHVLLEDVPGTGKTMLAKALAKSVDCSFGRVQFTPDLLPSELTGLQIYNPKTGEFAFKQGALFAGILLADEINRATPRTQSGLLESMEERQVTVDGQTHALPAPFFVMATQNPVETQGTFPLPEAQLDRFLLRLRLGYPSEAESVTVLQRHVAAQPLESLSPVCTVQQLEGMSAAVRGVYMHPEVLAYIVRLAQATREHEAILLGASTRAQIALARAAQAAAAMAGRGYATPDDVKEMLPAVLCHRLSMRATGYGAAQAKAAEKVVADIAAATEVPVEAWGKER